MAKHRGLREFTGDEIGNLTLGQAGFKMLSNVVVECGVTSGYTDIAYFIALKAVDVNAEVEARTVDGISSDDLTTNSGVYNDGGSKVTIENGDIIYGAFDKVAVASGDYVVAYIGKAK